jgi:lipooligosaccharide transport system ATP-binding protein
LIRTHIEPHVIEVYGSGIEAWSRQFTMPVQGRVEHIGETVFLYAQDEKPLVDELCRQPQLQFLHRRANLEDVFLKLTGRELRE